MLASRNWRKLNLSRGSFRNIFFDWLQSPWIRRHDEACFSLQIFAPLNCRIKRIKEKISYKFEYIKICRWNYRFINSWVHSVLSSFHLELIFCSHFIVVFFLLFSMKNYDWNYSKNKTSHPKGRLNIEWILSHRTCTSFYSMQFYSLNKQTKWSEALCKNQFQFLFILDR